MRRLFVFLFFSLLANHAQSQNEHRVSGYMGKRVVIGLGADLSFSLGPQKQSTESWQQKLTLNKMFSAHTEFAVSDYIGLGLRLGYNSTSSKIGGSAPYARWTDAQGTHQVRNITGTPAIRDVFFSGYFKWFPKRKGGLAPVGLYLGAGYALHNYNIDYSSLRLYAANGATSSGATSPVPDAKQKMKFSESYLHFGKAMPLWDKLILDLSLKGGWMFSHVDAGTNLNNHLRDEITFRLTRMYFINYSARLSFLL